MNEEQNNILNLLQNNQKKLEELQAKVDMMDAFLSALIPKGARVVENNDGTTTLLVPYEKK